MFHDDVGRGVGIGGRGGIVYADNGAAAGFGGDLVVGDEAKVGAGGDDAVGGGFQGLAIAINDVARRGLGCAVHSEQTHDLLRQPFVHFIADAVLNFGMCAPKGCVVGIQQW